MAPPRTSTVPLLADIDPAKLAVDVCQTVANHIHSLAMHLDMSASLRIESDASYIGAMGLGATVQALTLFAQQGLPVWDWTDTGCAADACLDVFAALYSQAGNPELGGGITDMDEHVEPDTAIDIVLLATLTRIRLDQRTSVAPRELAVLSGLTDQQVRHLIRTGEISAEQDGPKAAIRVRPKEAKRWLAVRGVRGFE